MVNHYNAWSGPLHAERTGGRKRSTSASTASSRDRSFNLLHRGWLWLLSEYERLLFLKSLDSGLFLSLNWPPAFNLKLPHMAPWMHHCLSPRWPETLYTCLGMFDLNTEFELWSVFLEVKQWSDCCYDWHTHFKKQCPTFAYFNVLHFLVLHSCKLSMSRFSSVSQAIERIFTFSSNIDLNIKSKLWLLSWK